MNKDLVLGGATLALSAGYYWMATRIPESQLADAIGPQGLPRTYAWLLGALSLLLIARALMRGRESSEGGHPLQPSSRASRAAGTLGIGILYVVSVPWLGYLLSIAGLIFTTTCYQGGAANRQVAIVAVAGAILCWVLFVLLMRIPQPPGLWPTLL